MFTSNDTEKKSYKNESYCASFHSFQDEILYRFPVNCSLFGRNSVIDVCYGTAALLKFDQTHE